jgi:hypothetical protein
VRVLAAIPHYHPPGPAPDGRAHGSGADPARRAAALAACVTALHQLFGGPHCLIDVSRKTTRPANHAPGRRLEVVVCTTRGRHLLAGLQVPDGAYVHHPTACEPTHLGFECHAVLRDRVGSFDYYCYLEDDLVLHDPWFFRKLAWFTRQVGGDRLLQPNRYEAGWHPLVRKAYLDGDQHPRATAAYQDVEGVPRLVGRALGCRVEFRRARNPHSGCFFLNEPQMRHWAGRPYFLDHDTGYIGPLESAATLGVMRTFAVYKPAPRYADFLEVEHFGQAFLDRIRQPG